MQQKNKRFIFTYGTDPSFPYCGGYTEIFAENYENAIRAFRVFHPDRPGGNFLNCAFLYQEERFLETNMASDPEFKCRERITVSVCREWMDREGGDWIMEAIGYRREVMKEDG